MRPQLWFTLLVLAAMLDSSATAAPVEERLFGLTNLWSFHLTLDATNWDALAPKEPEPQRAGTDPRPPGPGAFDREYPWSTATFEGAGQVFTNVALRFKGNSTFNMSRNALKRPFKLDFNRGAKGRTLFGHEELLLNNNVNDPAQFREALAYDVFRRAGLPAPRTAFATLHLTVRGRWTNEFLGLYTVVEAVEGDFLKQHFGTGKGLLVKPDRLPGLKYLGENWSAYVSRYDPKTEPDDSDTRRFIALTRLIDEADDAIFARELPQQFDIPNLLRFVAVNAVLANYDSLLGTGHNYYLFQPRGTGLASFIPWDLNEAFGGHPGAGDRRTQVGFSVLRPLGSPIRLVERLLANAEWEAAYRRELEHLMRDAFDAGRLVADAGRIARVTQEGAFAESPQARVAFERSALGMTNTTAVPPGENRPAFRAGGEVRPAPPFDPGPGPENRPGIAPRGPGPGMRFGRIDDLSFAEWVNLRAQNIAAELAGIRTASTPEMFRGPGRPPGRPQPADPRGPRPDGGRPRQPLEGPVEPR